MADSTKKTRQSRRRPPPARTVEGRENQLIALSHDVAEEQLLARTASSQVITHFLKLGTVRAQVELEKLKRENELIKAKTEALQRAERIEAMFNEAMVAFRSYHGESLEEDEPND